MMKIVSALLLSCATIVCSAQQSSATAHVYIYRPHNKMFGNGMSPSVSCGANLITKVPNGSYVEVEMEPGKCYMRTAYQMYFDEHPMEIEAGKTYYIRVTLVGNSARVFIMQNAFRLELNDIPESDAKDAMQGLKRLPGVTIKNH